MSGAAVSGIWSDGASGTGTCTTSRRGTCTISKSSLSSASVTFTVSDVSKSGSTYVPVDNGDPEGDSNGTTITVTK